MSSAEQARLLEVRRGRAPWRHWGPYLSERGWGTVREDYSADGSAWEYFFHYDVVRWLEGDPAGPAPPAQR